MVIKGKLRTGRCLGVKWPVRDTSMWQTGTHTPGKKSRESSRKSRKMDDRRHHTQQRDRCQKKIEVQISLGQKQMTSRKP